MIALKINEKFAKLTPKAALNFIIFAKFWELDFIKGNRTFNFKLPCEPTNQLIFNFPEDVPNSNKDIFKDYPAQIYFGNDLLYVGTFKLKSADDQYYEGFFKFDASEIAEFGDTSIRELLKNEEHTFPSTSITALNNYLSENSNIVFPTIKFGNKIFNRYDSLLSTFTINPLDEYAVEPDLKKGTFVAFLKLHYVMALIFAKMGYKIQNPQWYTNYRDVEKITIFNNKELDIDVSIEPSFYEVDYGNGFPPQIVQGFNIIDVTLPPKLRIADLVPNYTVRNFLNAVRKLLGLHFAFNSKFKTVKIRFLKDILKQTSYVDWTKKANPHPENQGNNYDGVEFSFKRDSTDSYQKYQKEPDIALQRLASTDYLNELHFFTADPPNTYRFYTNENQYHQVLPLPNGGKRCYLLSDFLKYKIGEGKQKIDIELSPVRKSRFLQFKLQEPYAQSAKRDLNKLRLYHDNTLVGKQGYIHITKAKNQSEDSFHGIVGDNPSYIDIEEAWRQDESGVQFTRYWRTDPILECDVPMTRKLLNEVNEDFAFRVFFYHGLQQKKDNPFTYPYASPDNLSPRGNQIADFSLRFEENGLVDFFYKELLHFWQYSNTYLFTIYLNINDLINFDPTQIVRIGESNFVVEDIDVTLSTSVEPAKVKLRKLVTGAKSAIVQRTRTITTIYQTDCQSTRTITTIYQVGCE